MTFVTACLLMSTCALISCWWIVVNKRIKVVDMAWMYKPNIHGDEYKQECLDLWQDYKHKLFITVVLTAMMAFSWYYNWSSGTL